MAANIIVVRIVAAEIVVHNNREQEYLKIQRMSMRMRRRRLLTLIGFKLLEDKLIKKKTGDSPDMHYFLLLKKYFLSGEIRLRAQEISARTKTVHGDVSRNLLGPSQYNEALQRLGLYRGSNSQYVPGHCGISSALGVSSLRIVTKDTKIKDIAAC